MATVLDSTALEPVSFLVLVQMKDSPLNIHVKSSLSNDTKHCSGGKLMMRLVNRLFLNLSSTFHQYPSPASPLHSLDTRICLKETCFPNDSALGTQVILELFNSNRIV